MMMLNASSQTGLFIEKQRLHEIGQEIDARRLGNTAKAVGSISSSEPSGRSISEHKNSRRPPSMLRLRPVLIALLHFVPN